MTIERVVKKLSIHALLWALILQLAIGSPTTLRAWAQEGGGADDLVDQWIKQGQKDPAAQASQAKLEKLAEELESAGENDLPQGSPDTFRIAKQTLEIFDKKKNDFDSYSLSDFHTSLPEVRVGNFDDQISIEIDRAEKKMAWVLKKGDQVIAKHSIYGVDVVRYAIDRELLQWVEGSGKIFVVDMNFARTGLFTGPIPVFDVARLPAETQAAIEGEGSSVAFITRGTRPPEQVASYAVLPSSAIGAQVGDENALWTAGDFAVFSNRNGQRTLESVYDRGVTLTQVNTQSSVLALLAYATSVGSSPFAIAQRLKNPTTLKAAVQADRELGYEAKNALFTFDASRLKKLTAAADWARDSQLSERDRYRFEEWQSSFDSILSRAETASKEAPSEEEVQRQWQKWVTENGNAISEQKAGFRRIFNARSLRKVAFLTATIAAVSGSALALADGAGPAWATHAANSFFAACWPDILKDAAYRSALMKSMLGLSSIMTVQVAIGMILAKTKNWSFQRALATFGIRAYAVLQTPFQLVAAKIFGQSRVISAMRAGVSPFKKIERDSAIGKKFELKKSLFPALNRLFKSKEKRAAEDQQKTAVLDEVVLQKKRAHSLAWLLANMVASEKFGVDIGVQLELQSGNYADEDVKALLSNRYFLRYWNVLSNEIYHTISSGADAVDFSNLSKKEIADYYEIAKKTAERISNQTQMQRRLSKIKTTWSEVWHEKKFKAIGNFGMEEYAFLRSVDPSEFVAKESWNSFWVDYIGTLTLNGLIGARADFRHQADLAASPNHLLWTNPSQLSDMIELNLQHTMTFPSAIAQKYSEDNPFVNDGTYKPIERLELAGAANPEKFMSGFLGTLKSIVNLKDANYGALFKKGLLRKMKSLQAGFIFYTLCRILVANQDISSIIPSFCFAAIWSIWASEWVWEPLNRGNYLHEMKIASWNERLEATKVNIAQGLRLGETERWQKGYEDLAALYSEFAGKPPRSLRKALDTSESALGFGWDELAKSKVSVQQTIGAVVRLKQAIDSEDEAQVEEAQARLRELHAAEESLVPAEADARALLAWSIEHPPVVSKANGAVGVLTLLLGSITTTVLATQMIVDTHHAAAWGEKIMSAAFSSAIIYSSIFLGQKLINNLSKTTEYIRLREVIPPAAFELAQGNRPHFESLEGYAEWVKASPEASQLLQNARVEDIAQLLKDARVSVAEINRERPAVDEIKTCALLLGKEAVPHPLKLSEKIGLWFKGMFRPPLK